MASLVKLVKRFYEENSRYEAGPPVQLIKQLQTGKLTLSDLEIGDEDIAVLIRLFNTKKAAKEIRRIEINRSSGAKVSHRSTVSAFSSNGFKLLRELLLFVSKCERLEMLSFESIDLTASLMALLGKALAASTSELKWLAFKSCNIGGDEGIRAIAPFVGKLRLQVLAFEECSLCDPSLLYLASIIKAQENNLDALYWNATLRLDIADHNKQQVLDETDFVYAKGLVALSLWGNNIEGKNISDFTRVLKKNNWLLGLSLGNNKLTNEAVESLVEELDCNNVLQSVLLRENDGFTADIAKRLYQSILAKSNEPSEGMLSANARLNKLTARVSWLLKSWMRLQCEETRDVIEQTLSQSFSRASLNTTQRLAVREHNLREIHRPYSIFSYLLEDEDDNEEVRNRLMNSLQDNPLILYDLEEGDATPNGSQLRSSQALTSRFIVEPYQSKNFEHLEYSKRYSDEIHRDSRGYGADELDGGIPTSSPHGNGKKHDWDYWPDEKGRSNGKEERPPSRISIRPNRINGDFVPVSSGDKNKKKGKKVPHYMLPKDAGTFGFHSSDQLRLIEERIKALSRSTSPQQLHRRSRSEEPFGKMPWFPSSSNPSSPLASRRRPSAISTTDQKKRVPMNSNHRYTSATTDELQFKPERKETLMRKRKKRASSASNTSKNNPVTEMYSELSSSVLKATKNLEQISKHLKTVAESLSESALLNLTNDHIQQQHQLNHSQMNVMDESMEMNQIEEGENQRYQPLSEKEETNLRNFTEELDLATLVRERMQLKLKDIFKTQFNGNHNV